MPLTINTNVPALNSLNQLNRNDNFLNKSLEKLSSGKQINSAADNAAGLAIANRLSTQINGFGVSVRNAQDGISLSQTAEGALSSVTDNLQRIRELSLQSANGSLSSTDRKFLQTEVNQLTEEINRVTNDTTFNGVPILSDDINLEFQVGPNSGDTISIEGNNIQQELQDLGVGSIDISTQQGAQDAIAVTDQALESIDSVRSDFGAVQNRFESTISNLQQSEVNAAEARSRIEDTDFAKEVSEQVKGQLLRDVGIAVQVQANKLPESILSLLEK